MSLLTDETDVFSAADTDRCVALYLARRQQGAIGADVEPNISALLETLAAEGWILSLRGMFDAAEARSPTAYSSGFAHNVDYVGAFEAPSIAAAFQGVRRLEMTGWTELFATEWLFGRREFAPVHGKGETVDRPWGFFALWEWNDAWCASTIEQRREYDAECDVAFNSDLSLNINIAGRHRIDWAHSWHHVGMWEVDHLETLQAAMRGHERASDFMFTTSRHFIGRRCALREAILGP